MCSASLYRAPTKILRSKRFVGSFYSLSLIIGLNNPSVLPSASHLPLHRGGYNKEIAFIGSA